MTAQPSDRFKFLDQIRELPSLPQVIVGISRIASNPNAGAEDLADVILKDQALTMKVLRIGNSAQYAMCPQRITTVSRAVVLLGFESVRAIALGLGAFNLLSSLEKGGRIHQDFWTNSVSVAVACQELATLLGVRTVEEAFVAGLLHDVGKLILAEYKPELARQVYAAGQEGEALLRAERDAFGVNHAEVADELARRWELPEVLRKALAHHHRPHPKLPDDAGERLAFLVGVAKSLTRPPATEGTDPRDLASKVARLLRKPVGHVLKLLQRLPARIEEYAGFFEIQIEDLKEYTIWLETEHRKLYEAVESREGGRRRDERRQAELAAMREIHALILQEAESGAIARRILRAAREVAGSRRSVTAMLNSARSSVVGNGWDGDVTPDFQQAFRIPLDRPGLVAGVVNTGEPVNVFDTSMPFFSRLLGETERKVLDAPAFAVLPVRRGQTVVGILYADRNRGDDPFSDEEMASLGSLADLLSMALTNAAARAA